MLHPTVKLVPRGPSPSLTRGWSETVNLADMRIKVEMTLLRRLSKLVYFLNQEKRGIPIARLMSLSSSTVHVVHLRASPSFSSPLTSRSQLKLETQISLIFRCLCNLDSTL